MKAVLAEQRRVEKRVAQRFLERKALVATLQSQDDALRETRPVVEEEIRDLQSEIQRRRSEFLWFLNAKDRFNETQAYREAVVRNDNFKRSILDSLTLETARREATIHAFEETEEDVKTPPYVAALEEEVVRLEAAVEEKRRELLREEKS